MNPLRILIADDHQLFLDGIKMVLSTTSQFKVVAEANSGQAVLDLLSQEFPPSIDIAILDINMPEGDGVETAKWIKQNDIKIKVLMLTMYNNELFIKRLMRAGVDGYILKENSQQELITALEALSIGKQYFASEVTQAVMDSFNPSIKKKGLDKVHLTKRELEVIQLVTKELTTQEIALKLHVAPTTVIQHRKNIMRKLDVRNAAGMVRVATEMGLVH